MKEEVKYYLNSDIKIQNFLKEKNISKNFSFSYFELRREEFLDIFVTRLEISESKPDGEGMGNQIIGLRKLVQNVIRSKAKNNILCISIKDENIDIPIYVNVSLTEFYGYIFE